MRIDGLEPDLPSVDSRQLLDVLFEVGPTMAAGMGAGPITFSEMAAWQQQIGVRLSPWQVRAVRQLSLDYILQADKSQDRDCPAPWVPEAMTAERRDALSRHIQNEMRARMGVKR